MTRESEALIRSKNAIYNLEASMYFVYIMTNKTNSTLYVGVTNDLRRRITEQKNETIDGFTKKISLAQARLF